VKRVLLTGGAGGIGVHVVAHLLDCTDWRITVLDSLRHKGDRGRLTSFCGAHPGWGRVTVLQHDLVCPISPALKAEIGPVDYILHLAALSDVGFSVQNPRYTIVNNVESTVTMLDYAAATDHTAFVYFSTDEVYGPLADGCDGHKEWDVLRPSNPYAASKAAGELFAYAYWRAGLVNLIITNTTNNFGETQGVSKYPAMTQAKLARGEKVTVHTSGAEIGSRYYLHSRNAADALLHVLETTTPHRHVQGEVDEPDKYHIVGDEKLNNLELAQLVAELMGKPLDYELVDCHQGNAAHDIHYAMVDTKLRASGWKPPVSLRESMKTTIDWHREHTQWL
jgi:dTDP-glucose 4,6-dehydratase